MPSLDAPAVSADRALWYHVSDLDFDFDAIADFYDQLALPAKPPLQDCRIHISSLAYFWPVKDWPQSGVPRRGVWSVDGVHLLVPEDACLFDALAPPANVLLLAGSAIRRGDFTPVVRHLAFGLMHYGLGTGAYPPMTDEETRLRRELARREKEVRERLGLIGGGISVVLQAALGLLGSETLRQAGGAFAEGLGFSTADQAADARAERANLMEIGRKILKLARMRDQSAKIPASLMEATMYMDALQFRLREGRRLRPAIVRRLDRDPGRISVEMRHLQRGLGVMPLRRWDRHDPGEG